MATVGTITADLYRPHMSQYNHQTPEKVEWLQTCGSVATAGGVEIFADATSSDDMVLTSINISLLAPTASGVFGLYAASTAIATFPTLAADTPMFYSPNLGPLGIVAGTTTTATFSIVGDGSNTATVQFFATGYRLK